MPLSLLPGRTVLMAPRGCGPWMQSNGMGHTWPMECIYKHFKASLISKCINQISLIMLEEILFHLYQREHEISRDVQGLHWCRWYKTVIPWLSIVLLITIHDLRKIEWLSRCTSRHESHCFSHQHGYVNYLNVIKVYAYPSVGMEHSKIRVGVFWKKDR